MSLSPSSSSSSAISRATQQAVMGIALRDPELVKKALSLGADPRWVDASGQTLLRQALSEAHQKGFESNAPGARLSSVTQGRLKTIRSLCEAGLDPSAIGPDGASDLFFAAAKLPAFYLPDLIKSASNINSGSERKTSPLSIACSLGRAQAALLLLEAGADPNDQDRDGNTALHHGAMRANLQITTLLLSHGASSAIYNAEGLAPWQTIDSSQPGLVSLRGSLQSAFIEQERAAIAQSARLAPLSTIKTRSL